MRARLTSLLLIGALVAACGSHSASSSHTGSAASSSATHSSAASSTAAGSSTKVTTRALPGLGTVLVNGQGRTLYTFAPDKAKQVTCVGSCAAVWPPLQASGTKVSGSGEVKASLVSSDPDPQGGRVVTYAGWPLYLYAADPSAGTANGQALNANGGLWYVISPAGKVITTKASAGSGTSSSGGSGY